MQLRERTVVFTHNEILSARGPVGSWSFCVGDRNMAILFTSQRELNRAENIKAVYDAYQGEKKFVRLNLMRFQTEVDYNDFELQVTDEFPSATPGKAIMINHSSSGGKTFGYDQPHPYIAAHEASLLTAVTCTSESMVGLISSQCHVNRSQVYPVGMPRMDALFGKRKGDGGTVLANKRSYLYAPTYRMLNYEPQMPLIDWQYIDNNLSDDEVLAIKPHMLTGDATVRGLKHVISLPVDDPSTPYVIDCDVLITDYSTIMSDAMVMGKPVILFEKDYALYQMFRGMYLDYPNAYSSRHCTNERDLMRLIKYAEGQNELDILATHNILGACDGHSTEKVLKLIEDIRHG